MVSMSPGSRMFGKMRMNGHESPMTPPVAQFENVEPSSETVLVHVWCESHRQFLLVEHGAVAYHHLLSRAAHVAVAGVPQPASKRRSYGRRAATSPPAELTSRSVARPPGFGWSDCSIVTASGRAPRGR